MDKNELKKKVLVKEKWLRGLFMLLFMLIKYLVEWIISLIAIFQFIFTLFADTANDKLLAFSKNLNLYLLQLANYLTYNTEIKPFPFSHWPEETTVTKKSRS